MPKDNRRVSYVFPTRNEDPEVIDRTLQGFLATTQGYWREIIIIDDASDVPVACDYNEVTVVRNTPPIGACRSRRLGCSIATGNVLITTDAHMTFGAGWLEAMLAHVDTQSLLCAPWMDYERRTTHCWGADLHWSSERDHYQHKVPGMIFRHRQRPPAEAAAVVPMVIGACYMMRRDAYDRMGGYNPYFQIWGSEEQDLSARAWMGGFGVRCIRDAAVGHLDRGGGTTFPYPVTFDYIEFNQLLAVKTVFEEATAERITEAFFEPLPANVRAWFDEADLSSWRAHVQSLRRMDDAEFFRRFLPTAPLRFDGSGVRIDTDSLPGGTPKLPGRDEEEAAPVSDLWVSAHLPGAESALWRAASCVRCWGRSLGIRVTDEKDLVLVQKSLPAPAEPRWSLQVDVTYSVQSGSEGWILHRDAEQLAALPKLGRILDILADNLDEEIALAVEGFVFVEAVAVEWQGRAIVLPGADLEMLDRLLSRGAVLLSEAHAVFGADGRIHPYARRRRRRPSGGKAPARSNPAVADTAVPLGCVAVLERTSREDPQLTALSPGQAFLALMECAVYSPDRGPEVFTVLTEAVKHCATLGGTYGKPGRMARRLLARVDADGSGP